MKTFIKDTPSAFFILMFRWYCLFLFKRRFKKVWLRNEYTVTERPTLYYLNHSSWWDALIPFLLNEFRFHQHGKAIMEDVQLLKYPFFRKIGVFSINRTDKSANIAALRHALQVLNTPKTALFLFPEGALFSPTLGLQTFESGLAWLMSKATQCDIVPIALHQHSMWHDKPELFIHVGKALTFDHSASLEQLTEYAHNTLNSQLKLLQSEAAKPSPTMEKWV